MKRYAVINEEHEVVNVILWDGEAEWKPPEGCTVEQSDTSEIGDTWEQTT